MQVRRMTSSIPEARENENLRAKVEEQAAMIEYISIMADVELPGIEDVEDVNNMEDMDDE